VTYENKDNGITKQYETMKIRNSENEDDDNTNQRT